MNIRIATATTAVIAAGVLAAAGTPTLSQAAGGSGLRADDGAGPPTLRIARASAAVDPCVGGAQKKAYSGGTSGWFSSSSVSQVPGASFSFKGPASGKDTVFVDLTAFETYADAGTSGRAKVLLNGVDMAPSDVSPEYFYSSNNYEPTVGQYCARVGRGNHRIRVVIEASGGGSAYLYNPMLHVEVAD